MLFDPMSYMSSGMQLLQTEIGIYLALPFILIGILFVFFGEKLHDICVFLIGGVPMAIIGYLVGGIGGAIIGFVLGGFIAQMLEFIFVALFGGMLAYLTGMFVLNNGDIAFILSIIFFILTPIGYYLMLRITTSFMGAFLTSIGVFIIFPNLLVMFTTFLGLSYLGLSYQMYGTPFYLGKYTKGTVKHKFESKRRGKKKTKVKDNHARSEIICPYCGEKNNDDAYFCKKCKKILSNLNS